mmetsp:Transcript_88505/g.277140  ORF Transcript_88505/g.277140 Transcript_88505/m.277140 type:complete len:155 (-) Transcript_88505:77-541(-)
MHESVVTGTRLDAVEGSMGSLAGNQVEVIEEAVKPIRVGCPSRSGIPEPMEKKVRFESEAPLDPMSPAGEAPLGANALMPVRGHAELLQPHPGKTVPPFRGILKRGGADMAPKKGGVQDWAQSEFEVIDTCSMCRFGCCDFFHQCLSWHPCLCD